MSILEPQISLSRAEAQESFANLWQNSAEYN